MRVYITTSIHDVTIVVTSSASAAREALAAPFADNAEFGEARGVWVGREPLDANDGFEGDLTLAVDLPDEVFAECECIETDSETGEEWRTGRALVPAAVLNQYGPARIYDHELAGHSRRVLLSLARISTNGADEAERRGDKTAAEMNRRYASAVQETITFFDQIGWLTPLRVQEMAD